MSEEASPPGKTARNEQRKLTASSWNAIGLAFVAIGFVQPVVNNDLSLTAAAKLVLVGMVGYILHQHAKRLLARLED
jgi:preprotein translocase subunit Sss1